MSRTRRPDRAPTRRGIGGSRAPRARVRPLRDRNALFRARVTRARRVGEYFRHPGGTLRARAPERGGGYVGRSGPGDAGGSPVVTFGSGALKALGRGARRSGKG